MTSYDPATMGLPEQGLSKDEVLDTLRAKREKRHSLAGGQDLRHGVRRGA